MIKEKKTDQKKGKRVFKLQKNTPY
jgi:hypothetical protein